MYTLYKALCWTLYILYVIQSYNFHLLIQQTLTENLLHANDCVKSLGQSSGKIMMFVLYSSKEGH